MRYISMLSCNCSAVTILLHLRLEFTALVCLCLPALWRHVYEMRRLTSAWLRVLVTRVCQLSGYVHKRSHYLKPHLHSCQRCNDTKNICLSCLGLFVCQSLTWPQFDRLTDTKGTFACRHTRRTQTHTGTRQQLQAHLRTLAKVLHLLMC